MGNERCNKTQQCRLQWLVPPLHLMRPKVITIFQPCNRTTCSISIMVQVPAASLKAEVTVAKVDLSSISRQRCKSPCTSAPQTMGVHQSEPTYTAGLQLTRRTVYPILSIKSKWSTMANTNKSNESIRYRSIVKWKWPNLIWTAHINLARTLGAPARWIKSTESCHGNQAPW